MHANNPSNTMRPSSLDSPACPECGTKMRVTQIEPDHPGREKRTFKCPLCSQQIIQVCAI
jgi:predicted RNA-binding Zn-ribbon protein involved in translation (DUF1610 family)